jgi:hypothetical protein
VRNLEVLDNLNPVPLKPQVDSEGR